MKPALRAPAPSPRDASPALDGRPLREALVDLTGALVAADSAQPRGDTREAAAVLAGFLARHGVASETLARVPEKANVVATLDTGRPGPHLVLNGHLDTLDPGDEAAWTVPVRRLARDGGRLTGLGVGNMKAGVAALAAAFVLAAVDRTLRGRLTLTAVADEVVFGPDGAAFLLETRPDLVGDALLNAEGPGFMNLAVAEKGLLWVELRCVAAPGQGMVGGRGGSATARLAGVIGEIDAWNDETVDPPPVFDAVRAAAGPHGLRVSANVGRVEGGRFVSQIATDARCEVDFRLPLGLTLDAMSARLDALAAGVEGLSWRRIKGWDPNGTAPDHPLARAVSAAAAERRGAAPAPVVRLPASDAARWRARGVPAVCYGPQAEWASGVDDGVWETDVEDCALVYLGAIRRVLGAAAA